MKIMYVGCNPADADDLLMDSEVTELARLFRRRNGQPIDFLPFPRLPLEELPLVLATEVPDILHVAAHAGDGRLLFANMDGDGVELTGDGLAVYLNYPSPPKLVYLNACNSDHIATKLTSVVSVAIGTSAGISNRTARASAILFYDRILGGATVQDAYQAGRVTMEAMQRNGLSSQIFSMTGVDPSVLRLYRSPCLIAHFVDDKYTENKRNNEFEIEFGVAGCPNDTSQVVFFFDETADVEAEYACEAIRGTPVQNVFWNDESSEGIYGDMRAFATGTTTAGKAFTVASTVCEALEEYFFLQGLKRNELPQEARAAISLLRSRNGAILPTEEAIRKSRNTKGKHKKDKD